MSLVIHYIILSPKSLEISCPSKISSMHFYHPFFKSKYKHLCIPNIAQHISLSLLHFLLFPLDTHGICCTFFFPFLFTLPVVWDKSSFVPVFLIWLGIVSCVSSISLSIVGFSSLYE